jgi:hypothetical protein
MVGAFRIRGEVRANAAEEGGCKAFPQYTPATNPYAFNEKPTYSCIGLAEASAAPRRIAECGPHPFRADAVFPLELVVGDAARELAENLRHRHARPLDDRLAAEDGWI